MFPTHSFTWPGLICKMYIFTATQVYLVTHLVFYYYYYPLTLFVIRPRKWNHPRSINYWKISARPTHFIQLVLCAQGLSTLPQKISSVSHTLIYLRRAASISTALCHRLLCLTHTSATLALYLATLRTFWQLFFHKRYIQTNLAT